MSGHRQRRPAFLVASALCLLISVLAFGGLILKGDSTGRILFGVVWIALGIVWLGSYFGAFFGQA